MAIVRVRLCLIQIIVWRLKNAFYWDEENVGFLSF